MEFTTQVELDAYSSVIEKYIKSLGHDYEVDGVNTKFVDIKWRLEFEMREWGIKYAAVFVPTQEITISLDVYRPNSEESEVVDIDIKLDEVEVEDANTMPFCPDVLELDGKKWCLKFHQPTEE